MTVETRPKTVELGNVILLTLVVFIVVWGLVYGLWRFWPIPAVMLAWVLMGRKH